MSRINGRVASACTDAATKTTCAQKIYEEEFVKQCESQVGNEKFYLVSSDDSKTEFNSIGSCRFGAKLLARTKVPADDAVVAAQPQAQEQAEIVQTEAPPQAQPQAEQQGVSMQGSQLVSNQVTIVCSHSQNQLVVNGRITYFSSQQTCDQFVRNMLGGRIPQMQQSVAQAEVRQPVQQPPVQQQPSDPFANLPMPTYVTRMRQSAAFDQSIESPANRINYVERYVEANGAETINVKWCEGNNCNGKDVVVFGDKGRQLGRIVTAHVSSYAQIMRRYANQIDPLINELITKQGFTKGGNGTLQVKVWGRRDFTGTIANEPDFNASSETVIMQDVKIGNDVYKGPDSPRARQILARIAQLELSRKREIMALDSSYYNQVMPIVRSMQAGGADQAQAEMDARSRLNRSDGSGKSYVFTR